MPRPRRQRHLERASRGSTQHGAIDGTEFAHRPWLQPELLQLAQGERRQTVATALVAGEHSPVDDEHVAPGAAQLDGGGDAGRPGTDDEDVDQLARCAAHRRGDGVASTRRQPTEAVAPVGKRPPAVPYSAAMPLNPDAVGTESEPVDVSWDSKDAMLYAVGVGAGTDELAFTTENTNGIAQRVLPTFPVVIGWGSVDGVAAQGAGTFNPAMVVHGTQAVTLHREIPPDGKATLRSTLVAMYDKEKAGVIVTDTDAESER